MWGTSINNPTLHSSVPDEPVMFFYEEKPMNDIPLASRLLGKKIGEWIILEKQSKTAEDNSGFWSTCYKVSNESGAIAFLKAFNYTYAFGNTNSTDVMMDMLENYTYERDVLNFCKENKMRRVVTAIDSGEYKEPNELIPVPYLVFEFARGNVKRCKELELPNLDWKLKTIHGAFIGLRQLHQKNIVHQDIKPSNILIFGESYSKISDLGSATRKGSESKNWSGDPFCGDLRYAPIELLYNHFSEHWETRRFGADLFMIGGFLTYLLSSVNFLHLLHSKIPEKLQWRFFGGKYSQVLPYILDAFDASLIELRSNIPKIIVDDVIVLIQQLCHPEPEKRGDVVFYKSLVSQYSLERYISIIDRLSKKVARVKSHE